MSGPSQFVESLESRRLLDASLVEDLNPLAGKSPLATLGSIGKVAFFAREDLAHGSELWRTDGSGGGTRLVKDIIPGSIGSYPEGRAQTDKLLYFSVTIDGSETLWRTDGTEAGTFKLRKLHTNSDEYAVLDDQLFFFGRDSAHGAELWRSDGTVEGTTLLLDIHPGKKSAAGGNLFAAGAWVYFTADDAVHGEELWRSDGTPGGTQLVSDFTPGAKGSWLEDFTPTANKIFFRQTFVSETWPYPSTFWSFDGMESFTSIASDVSDMASLGNTLYYKGENGSLWRTDGSVAGTKRLLKSGVNGYFASARSTSRTNRLFCGDYVIRGDRATKTGAYLYSAIQVGNTLYGEANGDEIWRSSGTPEGTYRLATFGDWENGLPYFAGFYSTSSQVFFVTSSYADDDAGSDAYEYAFNLTLWRTDGTVTGTRAVKEFGEDPPTGLFFRGHPRPIVAGNTLYFDYFEPELGTQLWKSGGTISSTRPLKDDFFRTASSYPGDFFIGVGGMYFTTSSGVWVINSDRQTTQLIDGEVKIIGNFKGKTLLTTDHALYLSDGTKPGTVKFYELPERKDEYYNIIYETTVVGERINFHENVYSFDDYVYYESDGTTQGTHEVEGESARLRGTQVGEWLVFVDDETNEWIRTDLDGNNRVVLTEGVNNEQQLREYRGYLYLADFDKLWRTDGTPEGTTFMMDLEDGAFPSAVGVGKRLILVQDQTAWSLDVTTGKRVKLLELSSEEDRFGMVGASGSKAFFSTRTEQDGTQLWTTDGTLAGTKLIKTFPNSSAVTFSLSAGAASAEEFFFTTSNSGNEIQLWRSDGTTEGTTQIELSAHPRAWGMVMKVFNSALYFPADDGLHGDELWRLDLE